MDCPGCGATTDTSQRFCHRCGFSLDHVYAELHEDATMEMSHDALEQALAARGAQSQQPNAVEGLAKVLEAAVDDYLEQYPNTAGEQINAALRLVLNRKIKD